MPSISTSHARNLLDASSSPRDSIHSHTALELHFPIFVPYISFSKSDVDFLLVDSADLNGFVFAAGISAYRSPLSSLKPTCDGNGGAGNGVPMDVREIRDVFDLDEPSRLNDTPRRVELGERPYSGVSDGESWVGEIGLAFCWRRTACICSRATCSSADGGDGSDLNDDADRVDTLDMFDLIELLRECAEFGNDKNEACESRDSENKSSAMTSSSACRLASYREGCAVLGTA